MFLGGHLHLLSARAFIDTRLFKYRRILNLAKKWIKSIPLSENDINQFSYFSITSKYENSEEICSIYLDEFSFGQSACVLSCRHLYHRDCIDAWLEINSNCPKCRSPQSKIARNIQIMLNRIDAVENQLLELIKQKKKLNSPKWKHVKDCVPEIIGAYHQLIFLIEILSQYEVYVVDALVPEPFERSILKIYLLLKFMHVCLKRDLGNLKLIFEAWKKQETSRLISLIIRFLCEP